MAWTRHVLAAATALLTVCIGFVLVTSPLAAVFLLDGDDLTGWGGATLWTAGLSGACCLVFAPAAVRLERLVLRRHRVWLVLVPALPIGAVAVVAVLVVVLVVGAPTGTASDVIAGAILWLVCAALYWSVLWPTHAVGLAVERLRRIRAGESSSTVRRHGFALAVTCAFPAVLVLALTLPIIAALAVIGLVSSGHTGFGDPEYWRTYLEVVLGAAGVGLAAGIPLGPLAWVFERLVRRGSPAWGVLAVWAPAGSVVGGAALVFLVITIGLGADAVNVAAEVFAALLFFFPVYWCALWLWHLVATGGRRVRTRLERRPMLTIAAGNPG